MSSARSRLGLPQQFVTELLAGHRAISRGGLRHSRLDKDDGWVSALVHDSRTFCDVGSSVGLWSVLASVLPTTEGVICWDANASALSRCLENLLLNDIGYRALPVLGFASDTGNQEVDFYTVGTGAAGSRFRGHARTAAARNSSMRVRTFTLDQVLAKLAVRPDFIKIDVEGAECAALEGSTRTATEDQPRILVEIHSPPELPMQENGKRVLNWCRKVGYPADYLAKHEYPESLRSIPEYASIEEGFRARQAAGS